MPAGQYDKFHDPLQISSRFNPTNSILVYRYETKDTPGLLFSDQMTRYTIRLASGVLLDFNLNGLLLSTQDRNGNVVNYGYDTNTLRLASIAQPGGRTITLSYDLSNRVSTALLPDGHSVAYSYDGSNNLASAQMDTPNGRRVSYRYDADHLLREVQDESGNAAAYQTFDVYGRVTGTVQTNVPTPFTKNYDLANGTSYATGPEGFSRAVQFNEKSDPVLTSDGRSNTTAIAYNSLRSVVTTTTADGLVYNYYYDSVGRRIGTVAPNGRADMTLFDVNNNPTESFHASTDASFYSAFSDEGILTTGTYSFTQDLVDRTRFGYDTRGNLLTVVDANSHTNSFGYDTNGNRIWSQNGRGYRTTSSYDSFARLTNLVNAAGHRVRCAYDGKDNLTQLSTLAGTVDYGYDAKNQLTSVTTGDPGARHTTSYSYNARHQIQTVNDPNSKVTQYTYDARGNLTQVTHHGIVRFNYDYDGLNRLVATHYNGTAGGGKAAIIPVSPRGMENLSGTITITWNTLGDWTGNPQVTIQYSADGVNWIPIATVNHATGSYVWNTGGLLSSSVQLRFVRPGDADFVSAQTASFALQQVAVSPTSYSFGSLAIGTTARASFMVTNNGSTTLHGTATAGAPFAVVSNASFTVPGFGTIAIVVSFTPPCASNYFGEVSFASDGGSLTAAVSGRGGVIPVALFSATPTKGFAPLMVTFTDSSTGTITNRSWNFGDGTVVKTMASMIEHGYRVAGTNTVTLTINGPAGSSTNTRASYIVVTNPPPPQLSVTPTNYDFGIVATGATRMAIFVVTNRGGVTLNGSVSTVSPFSIVKGTPFTLPGWSSTNVVVRFIPPTEGGFSDKVVFTSNGGNVTNSVSGHGAIVPACLTKLANQITASSAMISGIANPHGLAASACFQWGTNITYGNTTMAESIGSGMGSVNVSTPLSGLFPNTIYHFRLAVFNGEVVVYGGDRTFATSPSGSAPVSALAAGQFHSVALKSDGTVWTWGRNSSGQLGDGTTTNRPELVQVVGLNGVAAVAGGGDRSLCLKADGTVWGWGRNVEGQLGDGSTVNRITPVRASGLTDVVAVACGDSHSLALRSDGTAWAWGYNGTCQLGDETMNNRSSPVQVIGLGSAVALAGGGAHSMALKADGTVWAWGYNSNGQLGDGTTSSRSTPLQVNDISGVVAVAGGGMHNLALKADGTVWAWGYNSNGQLGNGNTTDCTSPTRVSGLSNVVAISCGNSFSSALKSDGSVWCWGQNAHAELGDGTLAERRCTPVQVSGLSCVVALATGYYHGLTLKSDHTVWSWGYNYDGELGSGTWATYSTGPMRVSGLTPPQLQLLPFSLDFGPCLIGDARQATLVINNCGQQTLTGSASVAGPFSIVSGAPFSVPGPGVTNLVISFTPLASGNSTADVIFVSNGGNSTNPVKGLGVSRLPVVQTGLADAVTTNSAILNGIVNPGGLDASVYFEWGTNTAYGDRTPLQGVGNGSGNVTISVSLNSLQPNTTYHFRAVLDGGVLVYGSDGVFTTSRSGAATVTALANGGTHSLALKADGTILTWGYNKNGQLGDGTTNDHSVPLAVNGLSGIVAVSGASGYSLALKSDGTVWAWGANDHGQLGDGTIKNKSIPTRVTSVTDVVAVAGGSKHTMVLKTNGTVWSWGANNRGQLGDGTTTERHTAVQVSGLDAVTAVSCGNDHSIALRSDGTVWTWGFNNFGALGDGTVTDKYIPGRVDGLSNVVAVVADDMHSAALRSDGTVWAWGFFQGVSVYPRPKQVPVNAAAAISKVWGVLKSDGTVWAGGRGAYGEFWSQVKGLSDIVAIATPRLALKADGTIWVVVGQLGDETRPDLSTPTLIYGSIPPELVVSPDAYDFGTLLTGTTGRGSFVIENHGQQPLLGTATIAGLFAVISGSPYSLGAGQSGPVTIAFSPLTAGSSEDNLVFISSGGTSTNLVTGHAAIMAAHTGPASAVVGDRATLNGTVNVNGLAAQAFFEWGSTIAYGTTTAAQSVGPGNSDVGISADVRNLSADTVYHYRLVVSNNQAVVYGGDKVFATPAVGSANILTVACGGRHSLALRADGTVWAWGANECGQLGDGTTQYRVAPVQVSELSEVIGAAGGYYHSVALRSDGYCLGMGKQQLRTVG